MDKAILIDQQLLFFFFNSQPCVDTLPPAKNCAIFYPLAVRVASPLHTSPSIFTQPASPTLLATLSCCSCARRRCPGMPIWTLVFLLSNPYLLANHKEPLQPDRKWTRRVTPEATWNVSCTISKLFLWLVSFLLFLLNRLLYLSLCSLKRDKADQNISAICIRPFGVVSTLPMKSESSGTTEQC